MPWSRALFQAVALVVGLSACAVVVVWALRRWFDAMFEHPNATGVATLLALIVLMTLLFHHHQ